MKIFISADIEGTTGIECWNETNLNTEVGTYFREQMTREVAAAAQGAFDAGATDVLVKDAHDSARNIIPLNLPAPARLIRGWAGHPFCMMFGLDETFDAVLFTGYHSAATVAGNPLSHTMDTGIAEFSINGLLGSEFLINAYTAAYCHVPVAFVAGDADLCQFAQDLIPGIATTATNAGTGNAVMSIHPQEACKQIQASVRQVLANDLETCRLTLPTSFDVRITYKEHQRCQRSSWYPGCERLDSRTLRFQSNDYFEVLRMIHFIA